MLKSIISFVLAIVMGISSLPSLFVPEKDKATTTTDANYKMQGTSSLGNIISDTVESNNDTSDEDNNDYYISSVIEDDSETLVFDTYSEKDCILSVGIYDEKNDSLIMSESVDLNHGEQSAEVKFSDPLPEYYVVKAGLMDYTGNPISEPFVDTDETEWYEDFEETTVDDFSDQYVVNLDINDDTNFIVFKEDVKVIENTELIEETEDTCKFDVSEETADLKKGDVFVYNPGDLDEMIVNKVSKVKSQKDVKTIYIEDVKLEEAFSFVKIHVESDETELHPTTANQATTRGITQKDYSKSGTLYPGSKTKNVGPLTLSISMTVPYTFTLNYNLWNRYLFISAQVFPQASFTATVNYEKSGSKDIIPARFDIIPGILSINFTLSVVYNIQADITFTATVSASYGFSYSTATGRMRNYCTSPRCTTSKLEAKGSIYVGLKADFNISMLIGIIKVGIYGEAGPKISAVMAGEYNPARTERHDCGFLCVNGQLDIKAKVTAYIDLDAVVWSKYWSWPLYNNTFNLLKFHYSFKFREFGWNTCGHYSYLTTVKVVDENGNPVKNAYVDGTAVGSNGIAKKWYTHNQHDITVKANGYNTVIEGYSIDKPKTITIRMQKGSSSTVVRRKDSSYYTYKGRSVAYSGSSGGGSYYVEPLTYTEPTGEYTMSTAMASRRSSDVAWVQRALKNLGYSITVDGYYGNNTASVVRRFQDDYGLPVTGKVDANTLSIIKNPVKKVDPPVLRLTSPAEMKTDGMVTVAWDAVPNATSYDIYVYDSKGNLAKSVIDTKATNAAFTLYLPDTYTIKGRAKNFRYTSEDATLGTKVVLHNKPLVTFVDWNGTVLSKQFVEYGTGAVTPAAPERYGYTFNKWDKKYDNVKEDITVTALYNKNQYTVTFYLDKDGKQTSVSKCYFEESAAAPSDESVIVQNGYTFVGWDKDFSNIIEDTVVKPVFKWENENLPIIIDNYTVTPDPGYGYDVHVNIRNYDVSRTNGRVVVALKNGDDRFVTMTESDAFTLAKAGTDSLDIFVPCKTEVSSVDIFVVNSYSKLIPISETKHYEVNQSDVSGNITRTVTGNAGVDYAGKQAILFIYKIGDAADFTNEYIGQTVIGADGSYTFDYCLREEPSIQTGDFIVTLGIEGNNTELYLDKIEAPKPVYTVTFKDYDGRVIKTEEVIEGEHATLPENNPEREGYIFAGWDYTNSSIYEDLTITAIYVHKTYTVVFIDWTNKRFDVQTYYYGEPLVTPDLSTLDDYNTIGWEDAVAGMPVTENMVITAKYEKKSFTVNFYDYDGQIIDTQIVKYGESASEPTLDTDSYNFFAWDSEELGYVTSSMDVRPYFSYKEDTAVPTASYDTGVYGSSINVTLNCADDADIYYSLNGGDFVKYNAPIALTSSSTLEFYASSFGKNDSVSDCKYYAINCAGDESNWKFPVSVYLEDELVGIYLVNNNSNLYAQSLYKEEYGYIFKGYSEAKDGTVLDRQFKVTKSMDIYIVREPETYQVIFKDINENIIDTQTVKYLEAAESPDVVIEEPGMVFVGWDTNDFLCVNEDLEVHTVVKNEKDILKITLNRDNYTMMEGYTYNLSATVTGETDAELFWSSRNENIATVDENGKITAINDGVVIITASLLGTDVYADCYLTVIKNPIMSLTVSEGSPLFEYEGYICGISPSNNSVNSIKALLNADNVVFSKDDVVLTGNDKITTGTLVTMLDDEENEIDTAVLIVVGDVDGNGEADNQDVSHISQYLVGKEEFSEEYILAADVNGDDEVNNKDASMLMRYVVNKESL